MTHSSDNSNSRLDRIEIALDRLLLGLGETKANIDNLNLSLQQTQNLANSNARSIQAIIEQQVTDRLNHQEHMARARR